MSATCSPPQSLIVTALLATAAFTGGCVERLIYEDLKSDVADDVDVDHNIEVEIDEEVECQEDRECTDNEACFEGVCVGTGRATLFVALDRAIRL